MARRVSLKGKGADLFFGDYDPMQPGSSAAVDAPAAAPPMPIANDEAAPAAMPPAAKQSRARATRRPPVPTAPINERDENHKAISDASTIAIIEADTIEAIRKVVKVPGREVSFVRLSPEEKANLAEIVYTYKRRGQKTSENEINRIAINYVLEDYHANGERSILARVLAALSA